MVSNNDLGVWDLGVFPAQLLFSAVLEWGVWSFGARSIVGGLICSPSGSLLPRMFATGLVTLEWRAGSMSKRKHLCSIMIDPHPPVHRATRLEWTELF